MTESLHHSSISLKSIFLKLGISRQHWLFYLLLAIVANAALWSVVFIYLKVAKPHYTSEWSVTLPAGGSVTNINLPNLGNATAQDRTPYDSSTRDPRENYKYIITSRPVVEAAAAKVSLPVGEFGKPRVQLIDNTTLMDFQIEGSTPEEAQRKSIALFDAFQKKINELRLEEKTSQDSGIQTTLKDAKENLKIVQDRLNKFKASSGLSSAGQIDALSTNIENLRQQRAVFLAEQQQSTAQLGQLSTSLNISTPQAAEAFTLNADDLFQQNLKDYNDATAQLAALSSQLGPNHPAIVQINTRRTAAWTALKGRGRFLLGRAISQEMIAQYNLNGQGSAREGFFQQVITTQVNQRGLTARAAELDRQIGQLENRLANMTQKLSVFEAFNRDVTIAEAIFSSTLARLNLGTSDTFGSYPQVQLLTDPSLPRSTSAPDKKFVFLGATIGSLFVTLGTLMLWLRSPKLTASATTPNLIAPGLNKCEFPLPTGLLRNIKNSE